MRPIQTVAAMGDRLAGVLGAERERWGLWLPVAVGAGIALYFQLPREPPLWIGGAALALAILFGWLGRGRQGLLIAALALGAVAAGFAAAQARTALVAAPVLDGRFGPGEVRGQVLSAEPRAEASGGARVVLQHPILAGIAPAATPDRVRLRLTLRDPAVIAPGQWIAVRARLTAPPAPAAPGAFDFARQAFFDRLGGVGYAVGHAEILPPPDGSAARASWRLWLAELRNAVAARVLRVLPGDTGAVAAALMTGERGAISDHVFAIMRDSGLAHLLAISGLHVGLVAGLIFFAVRATLALVPALALRWPIKKAAAVVAFLGALAYLFISGATVPTQRAFLMLGVVLLAVLLDRTAISLRLVAWAALLILLLAPESLLSASFQMSFAAVTALIAAYEVVRWRGRAWLGERGPAAKLAVYVGGVALTSVVAILATAPFAIYHFNRIAWYGLAANLVAVPLTGFWIMPWAILGFALMPFGLEHLALLPMGWGVDGVLATAETVAGWPGAVTPIQAMPELGLALVALGGLWLCLWRRPWRLIGLAGIAAGLLTLPLTPPPDLLVSGDGKLMALRDGDGALWLSSKRRARYTADVWLRRAGRAEGEAWPAVGSAAGGALTCDRLGCLYRRDGTLVALLRDGRALEEDCAEAQVLITLEGLKDGQCPGPEVLIQWWDLWHEGAHAVWLGAEGPRVRSVAQERGKRPWTRSGLR